MLRTVALAAVVLLLLQLLGSAMGQDTIHPEWCAGRLVNGVDGEPCPETRTEATPCPAGCTILVQQCETCGSSGTTVAILGIVAVLLAFGAGVVLPLIHNAKGETAAE